MIDIGRGFKAPFEDKDWISKTLLGFLWGLLGVTAPAVSGAQVEYIRSVSRGDDALPTWDDFGKKWVEGLLVFAAGFLYFLPVIVLGALFAAPVIVSAIVSGGDSDALGALFAGGFCFFWIVALVYIAGVSVLFSAAMTNYAMKESFGAFFALGEIMELVRGNTGYLTAWFYTLVIGFAGSAVASILSGTGVGAILAPAITYLVAMMSGNILGQWAAQAYQTTPQPASAAPAVAAPAFAPPPPAPPAPAAPPAASSAAPRWPHLLPRRCRSLRLWCLSLSRLPLRLPLPRCQNPWFPLPRCQNRPSRKLSSLRLALPTQQAGRRSRGRFSGRRDARRWPWGHQLA